MARRKDLTALAALGTLGYMLSKKGDKKDDKQTSAAVERRIAADRDATDQKTSGDKDDMFIEPGSGPYNQQFDDELPGASAPSRVSAAAPKKPAKPSSAKPSSGAAKNLTTSESQAARNALGEGSYRQDSVYNADKKGITSETRVPRFTPNEPPVQTHFGARNEENAPRGKIDVTKYSLAERNKMPSDRAPTDYRPVNERFKRGGKVKRMASGGMTSNVSSASKRADGIATKGKTRGKIC
jgi:hypothetical protein